MRTNLTQDQLDVFNEKPEVSLDKIRDDIPEVIIKITTTPASSIDASTIFQPVAGFFKKTGDYIGDTVSSFGDNISATLINLLVVVILVIILVFLLKHAQYKYQNKHGRSSNRRSSIPYRECVHHGNCSATIPLSSSCDKV